MCHNVQVCIIMQDVKEQAKKVARGSAAAASLDQLNLEKDILVDKFALTMLCIHAHY